MELFDYQKPHAQRLYNALRSAPVAVLDDSETGTGKTHTALWCARQRGLPVGVVCPPAVLSDWVEAAKAWGVPLAFATTYHKAIGKNFPHVRWTHRGHVAHWEDAPPLIIFDECQNMKSGTSRMGKLIRGVVHRSRSKALLLSATPAESPLDLQNVGEALGLHSGTDFRWWALRHGASSPGYANGGLVWDIAKADQVEVMQEIRAELDRLGRVFGMRWADAGLQHGKILARGWDLPVKAMAEYKAKRRELQRELAEPHLSMALRQAAELVKAEEMASMAGDLHREGRHVALFLNHTASIDRVAELLGADILDGRTADRELVKRRFQNNEHPFLAVQTQAGGTGLSLHDLHGVPRAALISPPWSAQQFRQILGRVDRANQVSLPVQVVVTARGTVEERVGTALKRKLDNLDALLDADLV